ncbi:MAG TPA: flagellar biosynthetic protein FliO [Accumulibacter sp.]|nr:flagellar biosynthetic protein FliO [Accumulibacter sp.]HPP47913.1 flagellar biosynthetic protein FliO [Accumulibacter sp.]
MNRLRQALVRLAPALYLDAAGAQTSAGESAGLSFAAMLQTLLSLALVIGLIFAAAYFLRRINGGRGFGGNGPLRVVGGLLLGPRERIVVLEIGEHWLVVGLTPGRMQTLHTLPKGTLHDSQVGDKQFVQWLKQIGERNNEGH